MAKIARKKRLAELLVDRYMIKSLQKFLKNTEIGSKENVVEKKEKWE